MTDHVNTLTEFLLERIAEDEAWTRRSVHLMAASDTPAGTTRVLAECEAKRRIVEIHVHHESSARAYRSPRWLDGMNDQDRLNWSKAEARLGATDGVLLILALPYAEHPDFQDEWRA